MSAPVQTTALLILSNVFMTWRTWATARGSSPLSPAGASRCSNTPQVPANRIGYTELDFGQLKILQEAVTLAVFVPFAFLYMQQPLKLNYLWAALCILGAVYFIFRD